MEKWRKRSRHFPRFPNQGTFYAVERTKKRRVKTKKTAGKRRGAEVPVSCCRGVMVS
jgi:hypothetical protein